MKTKKIIKEQTNTENPKNEVKERLEQYIDKGCAPNGKVIATTSTNPEYSYAIKQESTKTPGKFRYLYDIKKGEDTFEKRVAMLNSQGKLEFTGTWFCDVDLKYTEKTDFTRQKKTPQQMNAIKTYTDAGWEDKGGIINPAEATLYNTIDMKDIYGDKTFPQSYILVQEIQSVDTNEIIEELNNLVKTRNFADRKTCRQIISKYNVAKEKEAPVNDAVLRNWKIAVNSCRNKITNFNDLGVTGKIIDKLTSTSETENERWSLTTSPTTQQKSTTSTTQSSETPETPIEAPVNENYLRLKKIIRENLNELSETKKKGLLEEYKIINTRFKVISESGKPKTKKQKEKFADDLLSEILYLNSQGFNERLINEQFLDIIKSLFGNVPGGIFDTLKERFIQLILTKLGIDTTGYLGNIFIATIGDIPIGDYVNGKIFNCDYLTNAISKGIGEGIVRKIQNEKGMEGYFYDIIRNSLVDTFTDSSFSQRIEDAISKLVCPSVSKIKDKMSLAGEQMKQKALS